MSTGSRMHRRHWDQALFAAWLAAGPGAVVSHAGAAGCWDLPGVRPELEVTVAPGRRPAPAGVRGHRPVERVAPADRATWRGVVVTTPTRTLIDLSGRVDDATLAAVLDHCPSHRLTSVDWLRRRLDRLRRPGRAGAGRLIAALDDRPTERRAPESAFEGRLLSLLARLPGPPPVPQHEVRLPDGTVARLDVAYPDALLAIEADSYVHHSSATDWAADHTRRRNLIALGWRIFPVTWHDLRRRPEWLLDLVQRARSVEVGTANVAGQQ